MHWTTAQSLGRMQPSLPTLPCLPVRPTRCALQGGSDFRGGGRGSFGWSVPGQTTILTPLFPLRISATCIFYHTWACSSPATFNDRVSHCGEAQLHHTKLQTPSPCAYSTLSYSRPGCFLVIFSPVFLVSVLPCALQQNLIVECIKRVKGSTKKIKRRHFCNMPCKPGISVININTRHLEGLLRSNLPS